MGKFLRKNWFMLGLLGVAALAVADSSGITIDAGLWLKAHQGPDFVIVLIFFLSGLALDARQIRAGFADYHGTLLAQSIIFLAAPLLGLLLTLLPLPAGITVGLLLVSVMPSTLSSGVVMTGAAGGNMAHALLITIISNSLAVVTIPITLGLLLSLSGDSRVIEIDQLPIMLMIAKLVLLPLLAGLLVRGSNVLPMIRKILPYTSLCNQIGILMVVWMGACQGRQAIVASLGSLLPVVSVTFIFHLLLIAVGLTATQLTGIGKGRRESVILMGGQKTLPLSIILQVSLFPEYGLALVVCVLHHITHLAMDAFLVQSFFSTGKHSMNEFPIYPDSCRLTMALRPHLHEMLRLLPEGVSEFTFANLYLFRERHNYRLSRLPEGMLVILGRDEDKPFFMLPFGLPAAGMLSRLFADHSRMKCVTIHQKPLLEAMGYRVVEDRDNFDYLYHRSEMGDLQGRKFHKKRNLIKAFISNHEYTAGPLLDEHIPAALEILKQWREEYGAPGDYTAAREALEHLEELQLCGGIYFVEERPVAYTLGEELANGTSFVIHFEKAVGGYKGLYQFVNQSFASILPGSYHTINREQDLGDPGLRQAKHSYKPAGYVLKHQARI